jgi:hypothetical protein
LFDISEVKFYFESVLVILFDFGCAEVKVIGKEVCVCYFAIRVSGSDGQDIEQGRRAALFMPCLVLEEVIPDAFFGNGLDVV